MLTEGRKRVPCFSVRHGLTPRLFPRRPPCSVFALFFCLFFAENQGAQAAAVANLYLAGVPQEALRLGDVHLVHRGE